MQKKEYLEILEKARKYYFSIGTVPCPAFSGELVYFNKYGFNHIIRKGRTLRPLDEQIIRIRLIPLAVETVRKESRTWNYRTNVEKGTRAFFWVLKHSDDRQRAKVVIRRKGKDRLHFFSVIPE